MAMQAQTIPVRIYRGDEHVMLAAPLPGLAPENIWVTISGEKRPQLVDPKDGVLWWDWENRHSAFVNAAAVSPAKLNSVGEAGLQSYVRNIAVS